MHLKSKSGPIQPIRGSVLRGLEGLCLPKTGNFGLSTCLPSSSNLQLAKYPVNPLPEYAHKSIAPHSTRDGLDCMILPQALHGTNLCPWLQNDSTRRKGRSPQKKTEIWQLTRPVRKEQANYPASPQPKGQAS